MTTAAEYLQSPEDEFHLGCLLLSIVGREWLPLALEKVAPEDFADPVLGFLWAAARVVHGRGERVTKRTVLAECKTQAAAPVGGHHLFGAVMVGKTAGVRSAVERTLERLSGEPIYVDQIQGNIDRVRHTARMRRLVQTLDRIREHVVTAEDYPQAIGITRELLGGLEDTDAVTEATVFADLAERFEKTMASGGPVGEIVPTPWGELNELFSGGLHPGCSYVVGGRPSDGKSILGVEIARYAAEQGFSALVVSAEMDALEVTGRVMASGAKTEYGEITRWSMSEDTASAVMEYSYANRDMPLRVCDRPDMTIERVATLARNVKHHHGLSVLVIDYAQLLLPSDRRMSRQEAVSHISRSVKLLAKELECAVVLIAQLNRGNVREERRPSKHDLRESGGLEQDPDGVILIHHERAPDGSPTGMVTLIVDKNRHGRRGDVDLRWRGHQARIGD